MEASLRSSSNAAIIPGLLPMARTIILALLLPAIAACSLAFAADAASTALLHALLVGGGPDTEYNTAQIEEHLRFVTGLVPPSPGRIVLFADGKASSRDISYSDSTHLSPGQRALDILLPNDGLGAKILTRSPQLGALIDGPSRLGSIDRAFHRLAAASGRTSPPVLLYFAGHGQTSDEKKKTSLYNLWGQEDLSPSALLREIQTLPPRIPVTLVMAQCFSGGFGSVMFKKADPNLGMNDRLIIGFFAAESDREAAGCGTETSSPFYQDFSSYFFGALSGRDRLGHEVSGADFDGDGSVSCYEAYCYALIHDASIDTPVCTSLLYLRQYSDVPDSAIFSTPWHTVHDAATLAQRAVLDALSEKLSLSGEQRVLAAYDRLMFSDPIGQPSQIHAYRDAEDRLNNLRLASLQTLFTKWPALRWHNSPDYEKTARAAASDLAGDAAKTQDIVESRDAFDHADEALDDEEALLIRFTDLAEAIVRARHLRAHGSAEEKSRFESIWRAEQQRLPIKTY